MFKNLQKFNKWIALKATSAVGTMVCAYIFTAMALISLPSVLRSNNVITIVSWITQTFLQLVLLSVLMVGQNIMSETSEKRAEETHQIVKTTHEEQMQEINTIQELLKDERHEQKEMRKIMREMAEIINELKNKDNT